MREFALAVFHFAIVFASRCGLRLATDPPILQEVSPVMLLVDLGKLMFLLLGLLLGWNSLFSKTDVIWLLPCLPPIRHSFPDFIIVKLNLFTVELGVQSEQVEAAAHPLFLML